MKVFTNTNYATGKAGGAIAPNRIVGLDVSTGDVIQAIADTTPIGVSHNFAQDKGFPITVLPIGAGFARVKAGEALTVSDLGASIGPDAQGRAVKNQSNMIGVLAGLSADVEGATSAATDDDVVVLLCGVIAAPEATPESKGTLKFVVVDNADPAVPVKDIVISITVDGQTLSDKTDAQGEVEFVLTAGAYTWAASGDGYTYVPSTASVTAVAYKTVVVDVVATPSGG